MTERSYYERPIIKAPIWTPEIGIYFFFGGLAGASAPLSAAAWLSGNRALARRAILVALGGAGVSPVLLIKDLGHPARFHRMLRVVKPGSPMSVGTWVLSTFGLATGLAVGYELLAPILPASAARVGRGALAVSALTGPVVSTYTAVLVADTVVPAWHESRRELPFLFAMSSLASAGGAAAALTPTAAAGPARALAVLGGAGEVAVSALIDRRLDPRVKRSYEDPSVKPAHRASQLLAAAGTLTMALGGGRSRRAAVAGGLLLCAGAMATRWAVYKVGVPSAQDPEQTVGPQRERVAASGRRPQQPVSAARPARGLTGPQQPAPAPG